MCCNGKPILDTEGAIPLVDPGAVLITDQQHGCRVTFTYPEDPSGSSAAQHTGGYAFIMCRKSKYKQQMICCSWS